MTQLFQNARGGQYLIVSEFLFNYNDTMLPNGVNPSTLSGQGSNSATGYVAFNAAGTTVFDAITLPPNATVVGGEFVVNTAFSDTGTSTVTIGDSGSATRYLGSTSLKATGRTALTLSGYLTGFNNDALLTIANQNGNGTTGQAVLRVMYTIFGRVMEVNI